MHQFGSTKSLLRRKLQFSFCSNLFLSSSRLYNNYPDHCSKCLGVHHLINSRKIQKNEFSLVSPPPPPLVLIKKKQNFEVSSKLFQFFPPFFQTSNILSCVVHEIIDKNEIFRNVSFVLHLFYIVPKLLRTTVHTL